ncbi:MAG: hypothetical protein ACO3SN_08490, partial [Burkholderiaceae bacterium]
MNTRSFAISLTLGLCLFLSSLSGLQANEVSAPKPTIEPTANVQSKPSLSQFVSAKNSRVLFQQAPDIPMIDLAIEIDAGSRWDPEGLEGLADLTAQMAMAGVRSEANRPALREAEIGAAWADLAVE